MAYWHVNTDHVNNGDGDGWADQVGAGGAKNTPFGLGVSAGDVVFVKGSTDQGAGGTISGPGTDNDNDPVYYYGVKDATTNTGASVTTSDLVPGIYTGDSTRAYAQTAGNAAPIITALNNYVDIIIAPNVFIYGIKIEPNRHLRIGEAGATTCVECRLEVGAGAAWTTSMLGAWYALGDLLLYQCELAAGLGSSHPLGGSNSGGGLPGLIVDCETDIVSTSTGLISQISSGYAANALYHGNDFTGAASGNIFRADGRNMGGKQILQFNKITSGATLFASPDASSYGQGQIFLGNKVDPGTPLASGDSESAQIDVVTGRGTIDVETTAVRTGGASDGNSLDPWAWALTPGVNLTREGSGASSLVTPWSTQMVDGDGTSKTITVYIANSGAGDYQDDEVGIEVLSVSEDGNAKGTTNLSYKLGHANFYTPSNITDDTVSTWGTGAGNAQKITVTIAPDYTGPVSVRTHFFKKFAASPETLYVDPQFTVT